MHTQKMIDDMHMNIMFGADCVIGDTAQNNFPPIDPKHTEAAKQHEQSPHQPEIGGAIAARVQAERLASGANSLPELQDALKEFTGCGLAHTATNRVFFSGNTAPKLLIIGDCPDAQEDRKGEPFLGPAGQLLHKILGYIALDKADIMQVHVVFWRPPGNRTPTDEEVRLCQPFIHRLIMLANPQYVLAVGQLAALSIWNEQTPINRLRGTKRDIALGDQTIPSLITFQPSALLGNPILKRACWADMLVLQKLLQG
ncbi:MAG: uracil-DNA glycosylase [Pseudomonadota bacterium]